MNDIYSFDGSFVWGVDETPAWFSAKSSYRMNPTTMQIELPTPTGNMIVSPGDRITYHPDDGLFTVDIPEQAKLNREQRRKSMKQDERLVVASITVSFENGQTVELDTSKVMIIDKETKAELFKTVMEKKA